MRNCEKFRQLNEWVCVRCGYCYSVKDADPPKCLTNSQYGQKRLEELKKDLGYE